MQRALRRHGHAIAERRAVDEEYRQGDVRFARIGIEDACCLVRDERAILRNALRGDIALRDGPSCPTDLVHWAVSAQTMEKIHPAIVLIRLSADGGEFLIFVGCSHSRLWRS